MKNKYIIPIWLLIITTIFLAGCSGAAAATASSSGGLSTATRLAAGTLKLEGTSKAVTAVQAAQLLTLWEGYQSITSSDTRSQVELDALLTQIQAALPSDQLQAIEAMDLTEQSVSEMMQSMGGSINVVQLPAHRRALCSARLPPEVDRVACQGEAETA